MPSVLMSIKYRPAQLADIPAIAALLVSLFTIEQDFTPDPARQVAGLKLMLPREDILLWVAEAPVAGAAPRVIGFCSVQTLISTAEGGPVGLIEDVVVAEGWRSSGIGRKLLEGAEAWARRRGCSRLQLLADQKNPPALGFYAHLGWQQTSLCNWRRLLRD
jgi:GNAT superfamily N-acetyltransferase